MSRDRSDPIEARLMHARTVVERKVDQGGELSGAELVDVRDDLLFVYQHTTSGLSTLRADMEEADNLLDERKMNRNPTLEKALWILLPVFATTALGFVLWILTGGARG